MHRIVIVGAGFAGLTAAQGIRESDPEASITLVSPKPEFVYYPGLIWVPSASAPATTCASPSRSSSAACA